MTVMLSCDIVLHVEIAVMRDACQLFCALRVTSARNDVNACVFRRAAVVWCIVSAPWALTMHRARVARACES
jgi:hypothetical protein